MHMKSGSSFLALLLVAAVLSLFSPTPAQASVPDRDCGDFANQAAAQKFFIDNGGPSSDPHRLDGDSDGKACDTLPCPCSSSVQPFAGVPKSGGASSGSSTTKTLRQWARVIRVIDGDTIDVKLASGREVRVRLLGVDTPEMSPRQCGAASATKSARKTLPRGTRVLLVSDSSQARTDRYGRLLRYVKKGKSDVSYLQITRGWGRVFVVGKPFKKVKTYRHGQSVAKRKQRGIWGAC